jgi:hypothetical protein
MIKFNKGGDFVNIKYIAVFIGLILIAISSLFLVRSFRERTDSSDPQAVVNRFYDLYLEHPGNVLVDRVYQYTDDVAEEYKIELDETVRPEFGITFDPILCSQEKPTAFKVMDPVYSDNTALVNIETEYYEGLTNTLEVSLVKEGRSWRIARVNCPVPTEGSPDFSGSNSVMLFFSNSRLNPEGSDNCGIVHAVEREMDFTTVSQVEDDVLRLLFAGPTAEEQAEGYTSIFSPQTSGILNYVRTLHSTAYVNLTDIRSVLPDLSNSCDRDAFIASVQGTVRQFGSVDRAVFAINENPELFYSWIGISCTQDLCDPNPFK